MGELMGMVFSRISTIFMVWSPGVDDGADDRRHAPASAPMLFFSVFDALARTASMNLSWLEDFLALAATRQLLARRRGAAHDAARLQPAHPRAGGVAGRRAVRPQHPAGAADRGRRVVSRRRPRNCWRGWRALPRRGARGGRGQLDDAALRGHARAVVHLPAALAAGARAAHRRSARSAWCPTCCSAARRCCCRARCSS